MKMRQEKDALGTLELGDVYYGIQTERARHNFSISDQTMENYPKLIWAVAAIKKAAALANLDIGALDKDSATAICIAADEIMRGHMESQFPINVYHGGGGTSLNMNVNEVLANRANEILTGRKGYDQVHPNTHVNMAQSTNDVIPSAIKIASFFYLKELLDSLDVIKKALSIKKEEFKEIVKIGRTCLQDAVPITLGQQFSGYHSFIERQIKEIEDVQSACLSVVIGATAVGTGIGAFPGYTEKVYSYLSQITEIPVVKEENFFDGLQNGDGYLKISSSLKCLATGLSKLASDLRLLSSGPRAGLAEITLPAVQPGSSIMPGKINPVIPEMVIQVCFEVYGNDQTITMAVDRGELELNVWEPIILKNLFESCTLLSNTINIFTEKCIEGIEANKEICKQQADASLSLSTVLASLFGYEIASDVAKEAYKRELTIKEITVEKGLLTKEEANTLLDPMTLTSLEVSSRVLSEFKKVKQI